MTHDQVLHELNWIRIDLVETVLRAAVDREAAIDINLARDPARQQRLKTSVRGLSILYFYSFLQSHISDQEWDGIKGRTGAHRPNFTKVDWDWFDALKYVRDCFAHDGEGSLFPATQENTKHFQAIMARNNPPPGVTVNNDRIEMTDDAVFECYLVIRSILEQAELGS